MRNHNWSLQAIGVGVQYSDGHNGRERFAAEWLRHRGLAWAVDLLPEPQLDPLAGRREDAGQLPLALKDTTP